MSINIDHTVEKILVDGTHYYTQWVQASGLKATALKSATWVDIGDFGAWNFADGQEQQVVGATRVPDDMDRSVDAFIGIGWSSPTVSQNCDWELTYLPVSLNGDMTIGGTLLQSYEASSSQANGLVMSLFTIPNAEIIAGIVCIEIRFMRDGNDGSDNLGDVARIHGMCFKYALAELGK